MRNSFRDAFEHEWSGIISAESLMKLARLYIVKASMLVNYVEQYVHNLCVAGRKTIFETL